jgi:hypothetical protein
MNETRMQRLLGLAVSLVTSAFSQLLRLWPGVCGGMYPLALYRVSRVSFPPLAMLGGSSQTLRRAQDSSDIANRGHGGQFGQP